MPSDSMKWTDLLQHLHQAIGLARELKLHHLEYLLTMAELESHDRMGTVRDDRTVAQAMKALS